MSAPEDDPREERPPFRLGEWLVEPELDRITRGEKRISLRPRVIEVLLCLADQAGGLATKRQLVDAVWPSGFVTDNALTHLVAELRTALGDNAEDPRYVETIPRRGYRLIAPMTPLEHTVSSDSSAVNRFLLVTEEGLEIKLAEGENLIGRSPDAIVRVDTTEVSRRHAVILVQGPVATLEDLGSKNGTFLRGRRVDEPTRLTDADEIQVGVNVARFRFRTVDDRTTTEVVDGD